MQRCVCLISPSMTSVIICHCQFTVSVIAFQPFGVKKSLWEKILFVKRDAVRLHTHREPCQGVSGDL